MLRHTVPLQSHLYRQQEPVVMKTQM